MRTVYKYVLEVTDTQTISLPQGAKPLHVGRLSQKRIFLWAEVDTDMAPTPQVFYIRGTGHPLPDTNCSYVGTVHSYIEGRPQGIPLIWHVYKQRG